MIDDEFHKGRFARTRLARNPREAVTSLKPSKQVTRTSLSMKVTGVFKYPSERLTMSLSYGRIPDRTTFEA